VLLFIHLGPDDTAAAVAANQELVNRACPDGVPAALSP
jgi:hypothetical protein